jgi:hypothetical protein
MRGDDAGRALGPAGAAGRQIARNVALFNPAEQVFRPMLDGWRHQQPSRNPAFTTIARREQVVQRFRSFTAEAPWFLTVADVDEFFMELRAVRSASHLTLLAYQNALRLFLLLVPLGRWLGLRGVKEAIVRRSCCGCCFACLGLDEVPVFVGKHGFAVYVDVGVFARFLVENGREGAWQDHASRVVHEPLLGGRSEPVPLFLDVHISHCCLSGFGSTKGACQPFADRGMRACDAIGLS